MISIMKIAPHLRLVLMLLALLIFNLSSPLTIDSDEQENDFDYQDDDRAFIVATGVTFGNVLGLNLTALLPLFALSSLVWIPLLILCLLSFLLYAKSYNSGPDYNNSGYYRSLGLDVLDWESISIIDWLDIAEETFRKFDPTDVECHKKVICEIHQNVNNFGWIGSKFVTVFGYLRFFEIFGLPPVIMDVVDEYLDAANKGRSLKKNCADFYQQCNFSVKKMHDHYSHNEIK